MMTVTTTEAGNDIGKLLDIVSEESARQFGCGQHLLSGAEFSVNDLLAVPIEAAFSEYLPA
jgi:hypothetical protein